MTLDSVIKIVKESGPILKDIASLVNHAGEKLFLSTPEEREELKQMAKMAWSYEEKNTLHFSINDAASWFKYNMPDGIREGCILKHKTSPNYELHLCFLKDEIPLLDGDYPHLLVKAHNIGDDLKERFKRADLIKVG
jgi:hypothetical protein